MTISVQEFEVLPGQVDDSMPFYQALSRVLGGANGNELLGEVVSSLDHNPSAAGYSLFSRTLDNATRWEGLSCRTEEGFNHAHIPNTVTSSYCFVELEPIY